MDTSARARRDSNFNVLLNSLNSTRNYFLQAQLTPPYSHHTIFTFLVPVLLELLQLRPDSPFETHPMTMRVALASLSLYCLALDTKLRIFSTPHPTTVYACVMNRCIELSGWLSVVSLGSIHFPDPLVVWALYFVYTLFSVSQLGWSQFQVLQRMTSTALQEMQVMERHFRRALIGRLWFMTPASTNRRRLLPM